MNENSLQQRMQNAAASAAYQNYREVRERVIEMLNAAEALDSAPPSKYWEEELAGFLYMFDASALIIERLRHHCYHLTGLREYDYRAHHAHQTKMFARKLAMLQAQDQRNLLVSESPQLGGYGYLIDGARYNLDTLRFYECLIALDRAGALDQFRERDAGTKTVVEIGAGWGGFAYQFKTLFPAVAYVIVDFPECFLFSATYLKTLFPEARFCFITDQTQAADLKTVSEYDFVFIPRAAWSALRFFRPDIAINMVSFQEMTDAQVDEYVGQCARWGIPNLYSMNRDRSRHNKELSAVSAVISRFYRTQEIRVLDLSASRLPASGWKRYLQPLAMASSRLVGIPRRNPAHEYRHLIGRLPNA